MITPAELANEAKRHDEQQQNEIEAAIDTALFKSGVKPGETFTYAYPWNGWKQHKPSATVPLVGL